MLPGLLTHKCVDPPTATHPVMATRFVKASQNRQYLIQLHAVEGRVSSIGRRNTALI